MFSIHVTWKALRSFGGKDRVKDRRLEADRCERVFGARSEASFCGKAVSRGHPDYGLRHAKAPTVRIYYKSQDVNSFLI
jgi:hypothetical protein